MRPPGLAALFAAIVSASVAVQTPALAVAGTFDVDPSVVVASTCTYNGTGTLSFGAYDPVVANASLAATATGTVSVTCPDTLAYTLTANTGLYGTHASGSCATATCTRAMLSGSSYLSYDIYTTSAHTTVWNATNSIAGTGSGIAQSISVYGYIPPAEVAPAGSYADTVTVTVTF
ncbi:MAG TPA: spore coat U domain-containing protein [Verrucomicrobiae bacterium]|nr:spore coat U domain-containing protein [Verrucomicrobiae bacterium]